MTKPKGNYQGTVLCWYMFNLVLPLIPFVIAGIIRLTIFEHFDIKLATFKASDLAISMGIQSILVSQSILNYPRLLDNPNKRRDAHNKSFVFLIMALVFFCFIYTF